MILEIWKPVIGHEGKYETSNFGNIKNILTDKIMKAGIHTTGYSFIKLWENKKQLTYFIHRLVATAFIPNPV